MHSCSTLLWGGGYLPAFDRDPIPALSPIDRAIA